MEHIEMIQRLLSALEHHTEQTRPIHSTELAIEAAREHLRQAAKQPKACFIGARGSAFDSPETKRAYTYKEQPGNAVASKLGRACEAASRQSAGDGIDRGLGLLQQLQNEGFGVFDLGAEYTYPAPTQQPLTDDAKDAKDAERYRWLKSRMMGADFDWNESGACALVFEWPRDVPIGADCDRNIDCAIEAAHSITGSKT